MHIRRPSNSSSNPSQTTWSSALWRTRSIWMFSSDLNFSISCAARSRSCSTSRVLSALMWRKMRLRVTAIVRASFTPYPQLIRKYVCVDSQISVYNCSGLWGTQHKGSMLKTSSALACPLPPDAAPRPVRQPASDWPPTAQTC